MSCCKGSLRFFPPWKISIEPHKRHAQMYFVVHLFFCVANFKFFKKFDFFFYSVNQVAFFNTKSGKKLWWVIFFFFRIFQICQTSNRLKFSSFFLCYNVVIFTARVFGLLPSTSNTIFNYFGTFDNSWWRWKVNYPTKEYK